MDRHSPASAKSTDATWYGDYGGYVAIGYNPAKVKVPPTSFKDLLKPMYKNQIAINNNPTQASAAFSAVWAAALANGGSFGNIQPGISFFAKLHKDGNFQPVVGGPEHRPERPDPDPGLVGLPAGLRGQVASDPGLQDRDPDATRTFAAYYDQAINAGRPEPGRRPAVGGVPVQR